MAFDFAVNILTSESLRHSICIGKKKSSRNIRSLVPHFNKKRRSRRNISIVWKVRNHNFSPSILIHRNKKYSDTLCIIYIHRFLNSFNGFELLLGTDSQTCYTAGAFDQVAIGSGHHPDSGLCKSLGGFCSRLVNIEL